MKDYLIIGQGIAGSLLGYELLKRGRTIRIINQTNPTSSSNVAAGLYNPITGRKMVKTWNCDKIFPDLESYYRNIEVELESKFLHDIGIYRPFFSIEEQNDWQGKMSDPSCNYLIEHLSLKPGSDPLIKDPFGGIHLKYSGYVDVSSMLKAFKCYFEDRGLYREGLFYTEHLEISDNSCNYENEQFRMVIFCDGALATNNAFFNWLPFRLVKGELLDISVNYKGTKILNRGVFLLPLANNLFRLGATYDNHHLTLQKTQSAVDSLTEKLNLIFDGKFETVKHRVGIRPATKDRKPLIGVHPEISQVGIFNGLGAKGVSLGAYYSKQFADNLVHNKPLDNEVNISRFFSLNSFR